MTQTLAQTIARLQETTVGAARQEILQPIILYWLDRIQNGEEPRLHFICTHNSRRSQFSQIWAATAAHFYGLPLLSTSGGVEVTACNERTIAALQADGFLISSPGGTNPRYQVRLEAEGAPWLLFSKLYDDPSCPTEGFAAVMTCSDADENCPFIPGTSSRLPLRFEDPKYSDGTAEEAEVYRRKSREIGTELFFIAKEVKQLLDR